MVWARTKLVIWEDVYEDVTDIIVRYSGPHPERFYKKVLELMEKIFALRRSDIQEIDYTWEKTETSAKFKVWWRLIKSMDVYSYLRWDLKLEGSSAHEKGYAMVKLTPILVTEYPQDTLIQQSIFYEMLRRFWHQVFYHKKRMQYMVSARDLSTDFELAVKKFAEELRGETTVERARGA